MMILNDRCSLEGLIILIAFPLFVSLIWPYSIYTVLTIDKYIQIVLALRINLIKKTVCFLYIGQLDWIGQSKDTYKVAVGYSHCEYLIPVFFSYVLYIQRNENSTS